MSFSLLNPIFTKIPQLLRFSTPAVNKLINVPSAICTSNAHTLSKQMEFSFLGSKVEKEITEDVLKKVNEEQDARSRAFAIIQICGKQFKVTNDDVVIVEGYWPPNVGDKLRLEKVLVAGGANFSLIGTPLVQPGLVNVYATVIEKNLSHTKTHFRKKRRKQYLRINFMRVERTMLRINEIGIGELEESITS